MPLFQASRSLQLFASQTPRVMSSCSFGQDPEANMMVNSTESAFGRRPPLVIWLLGWGKMSSGVAHGILVLLLSPSILPLFLLQEECSKRVCSIEVVLRINVLTHTSQSDISRSGPRTDGPSNVPSGANVSIRTDRTSDCMDAISKSAELPATQETCELDQRA